jgi:hypothetical protein
MGQIGRLAGILCVGVVIGFGAPKLLNWVSGAATP